MNQREILKYKRTRLKYNSIITTRVLNWVNFASELRYECYEHYLEVFSTLFYSVPHWSRAREEIYNWFIQNQRVQSFRHHDRQCREEVGGAWEKGRTVKGTQSIISLLRFIFKWKFFQETVVEVKRKAFLDSVKIKLALGGVLCFLIMLVLTLIVIIWF